MKRIFLFFLSLILWTNGYAINQVVFFGDSLTDNGNYYDLLLHYIPSSPPYYKGRFSNGPTWAEQVGNYYYRQYYSDYHIYAVGGATAVLHNPLTDGFIAPTTLQAELYAYLAASLFKNKSDTLYSIWIGGNDYLFESDKHFEALTSRVIKRITWTIKNLIAQGGQYFLIMNLPDLSATPYARNHQAIERLHALTLLHNQKLDQAIADIKQAYPKIHIILFDTYRIFSDLLNDPDKYNNKYHKHISQLVDACWTGLPFLKANQVKFNNQLAIELNQAYYHAHQTTAAVETQALATYILHSPSLAEAYYVNKLYQAHLSPCTNADEYLFWDELHPTAVTHEVLGSLVIEALQRL